MICFRLSIQLRKFQFEACEACSGCEWASGAGVSCRFHSISHQLFFFSSWLAKCSEEKAKSDDVNETCFCCRSAAMLPMLALCKYWGEVKKEERKRAFLIPAPDAYFYFELAPSIVINCLAKQSRTVVFTFQFSPQRELLINLLFG